MGPLLTVTQILRHIWMHIPVAMWSFGIYKPGYHAATFNGDKLQSSLYHGVPGRQYVKVAIATKKNHGIPFKKTKLLGHPWFGQTPRAADHVCDTSVGWSGVPEACNLNRRKSFFWVGRMMILQYST